MSETLTAPEKLECGCQFFESNGDFVFEPCTLSCQYYLFVVEESKRQAKTLTHLDLR